MNERLQEFRNRLRGPAKAVTNWQFWIGSPTAWLALFISSATAFYSLVYHSDAISVVTTPISMTVDKDHIYVPYPKTITFINSGSRPIAILDIWLTVKQAKSNKDLDCRGSLDWLVLAFDQLVLKPYDITAREMRFRGSKEDRLPVDLSAENKNVEEPTFVVCLSFEFVATDSPRLRKTILLARLGKVEAGQARYDRQPAYLIKRNTFSTAVGAD